MKHICMEACAAGKPEELIQLWETSQCFNFALAQGENAGFVCKRWQARDREDNARRMPHADGNKDNIQK